jgi:putative inorganic carbon (HCO3(-)) transporter
MATTGDYAWRVLALATVDGPLPKLGVVAVALLAAGAMLVRSSRPRALCTLAALVLAPVLLVAEIWHAPQLRLAHQHPLWAVGAGLLALAVLAAAARQLARARWLVAPLALAALPFRVPIAAGGSSADLLVPLYFVIAAGALAESAPALRRGRAEGTLASAAQSVKDGALRAGDGALRAGNSVLRAGDGALRAGDSVLPAGDGPLDRGRSGRPARRLPFEWALAAYLALYAAQALYSVGFEKALQNVVFFYVPFALLFAQLRDLRWDHALLRRCLLVETALALIFAAIGFGEYATRTLLFNEKLIASNELHPYFAVNSVFFDPDVFGRFLALVMVVVAAALIWARSRRLAASATVVLAVLWAGLLLTLSRSSLGALLVGLAALYALRWRLWPVLGTGAAVIAVGLAALAFSPTTFGLNQGLNGASSGRASLITGGGAMFEQRPILGYGSGAFVTEYRHQHPQAASGVSASHTIPVTIAAEQGVVGLVAYVALLGSALVAMLRRARGDPIRAAIAAAFLALIFNTMLYADFLEDPATWTLLAIGAALARLRWEAEPTGSARARSRAAAMTG